MRKINILASFFVVALLIVSCGGPQKMADNASLVKYTVTPDPLEVHGGKVALTIDVKYPEKYFHKKAIVVATPFIKYEDGEKDLTPKTLQGEAVEDNNTVISFTTGGSFKYEDTFDYTDEMMKSELFVRGDATVGKKKVALPPVKIADGIITTPLLVNKKPRPIYFGDNFKRIVPEVYQADIHYVINRYDVRDSELKQEDIEGMKKFLISANENERVEMKGIGISAYASPDGAEDLNTKLSGNRESSASRYLKNTIKKSKIAVPEDKEFFSMMTTPEDWDGFKKLMEESTITDKDLILRVLSMYSDPIVREKEIKNISAAFEEIKVDILPKLRRANFAVNVEKVGYSDEELVEIVKNDLDTLNLEELLYAASLFKALDVKFSCYTQAVKIAPKCIRAHNNLACVLIEKGDLAGAKKSLATAKELKDHNIVKNNLGVIAFLEMDLEGAEELFTSAMGAGDEVNFNLGIIKIMQGDYEAAQNYYGGSINTNSALTKVLLGSFGQAIEIIDKIEEPDGRDYYVKAVAGARDGNPEIVFNALRTSIAKQPKFKARAAKDLEFSQWFEDAAFQEIVK
jgi:tetratricopeptide (TPR) repeat protein